MNVVADPAVRGGRGRRVPELREAVLASTGLAPQIEVVERRGARRPRPSSCPWARCAAMAEPRKKKVAAALSYPGHGAPKVVAAGKGHVAERILELAREAGVPTREDSALAQALAELELGRRCRRCSTRRLPRRSCGRSGSTAASVADRPSTGLARRPNTRPLSSPQRR